MQIIGVDLHTRQQTVAMLNVETGEIVEKALQHEGDSVREFYSTLAGLTRVGIEATGSMQCFLELMEELGIDYDVGHPAKIRAADRGNKSTIDEMPRWCCSCWLKTVFLRSGCLRVNNGMCAR